MCVAVNEVDTVGFAFFKLWRLEEGAHNPSGKKNVKCSQWTKEKAKREKIATSKNCLIHV